MKGRRLVGIGILVLIVLGAVAYNLIQNGTISSPVIYEPVTLRGFVEGDKMAFLEDPQVKSILKQRYRIDLDLDKAGSIDMVKAGPRGADFLWPSSQIALEMYAEQSQSPVKEEVIFSSPVVLYSWDKVANALEAQGIAKKMDDGHYTVDMTQLTGVITSGTTWKDLGLPELYGKVKIASTDPARSANGNQFAGLLANVLNNGNVVDEANIDLLLPKIKGFFTGLGLMPTNSDELFAQYLKQGSGAYPLVVGTENQIIEFAIANKQYLPFLKDKTRVLYPQPTVWSNDPLIVVNDKAERLVTALRDPEVQKIAWSKHGFRTSVGPGQNDPTVLPALGVTSTVDQVIPMPKVTVMERIIKALSQ